MCSCLHLLQMSAAARRTDALLFVCCTCYRSVAALYIRNRCQVLHMLHITLFAYALQTPNVSGVTNVLSFVCATKVSCGTCYRCVTVCAMRYRHVTNAMSFVHELQMTTVARVTDAFGCWSCWVWRCGSSTPSLFSTLATSPTPTPPPKPRIY